MNCLFLLFIFLFNSCQNNEDTVAKKLTGDWAIEQMSYEGNNYLNNLYANTLFLEKNNSITLPQTFDSEEENAFWNISKNGDKIVLEIKSGNHIFKGKYDVKFIKNNHKKLLGVELKSDKTHIIAYKFLQNFEIDGKWW